MPLFPKQARWTHDGWRRNVRLLLFRTVRLMAQKCSQGAASLSGVSVVVGKRPPTFSSFLGWCCMPSWCLRPPLTSLVFPRRQKGYPGRSRGRSEACPIRDVDHTAVLPKESDSDNQAVGKRFHYPDCHVAYLVFRGKNQRDVGGTQYVHRWYRAVCRVGCVQQTFPPRGHDPELAYREGRMSTPRGTVISRPTRAQTASIRATQCDRMKYASNA